MNKAIQKIYITLYFIYSSNNKQVQRNQQINQLAFSKKRRRTNEVGSPMVQVNRSRSGDFLTSLLLLLLLLDL